MKCPEALAQGRAGGALGAGAGGAGIAQKCVEVKAAVNNVAGKVLEGAGVFGRVDELQSGMSASRSASTRPQERRPESQRTGTPAPLRAAPQRQHSSERQHACPGSVRRSGLRGVAPSPLAGAR